MSKDKVLELADLAVSDSSWLISLIDATKWSKPKNRNRKAAWVIHHIFLRHPQLIEGKVLQLIEILDISNDTSVYREILKVIAEIKISVSDFSKAQTSMFDLGVGILYDDTQSKGMNYIGIRIIERFITSESERAEGIEAIKHHISTLVLGKDPMCKSANNAILRIERKKLGTPK
ncbi:MAG TPA: hypothetical protein EYM86_00840 [Flavobacteriales bacterium]|nr:hypothetical protein [Flavobacteriales bacterium]HIB76779.1 hypothetical protein [Flavobacteriales bacterium]HIN40986.1 hypothetical protein [Flavobacteriales bacterium]HIO15452.1 hypothetical protein [Flavobacteriales bacterium]